MKAEGTNLLLLTISAFWSSVFWRQRSIPLGGRYRQVSLYDFLSFDIYICETSIF